MDKKISEIIKEKAIPENKGEVIHLGFNYHDDLTDDDIEELKSWESLGATLKQKIVNDVTFTIDVYLSDE